jgi:hypothetical protein
VKEGGRHVCLSALVFAVRAVLASGTGCAHSLSNRMAASDSISPGRDRGKRSFIVGLGGGHIARKTTQRTISRLSFSSSPLRIPSVLKLFCFGIGANSGSTNPATW